jgi:hypothetical protein
MYKVIYDVDVETALRHKHFGNHMLLEHQGMSVAIGNYGFGGPWCMVKVGASTAAICWYQFDRSPQPFKGSPWIYLLQTSQRPRGTFFDGTATTRRLGFRVTIGMHANREPFLAIATPSGQRLYARFPGSVNSGTKYSTFPIAHNQIAGRGTDAHSRSIEGVDEIEGFLLSF